MVEFLVAFIIYLTKVSFLYSKTAYSVHFFVVFFSLFSRFLRYWKSLLKTGFFSLSQLLLLLLTALFNIPIILNRYKEVLANELHSVSSNALKFFFFLLFMTQLVNFAEKIIFLIKTLIHLNRNWFVSKEMSDKKFVLVLRPCFYDSRKNIYNNNNININNANKAKREKEVKGVRSLLLIKS